MGEGTYLEAWVSTHFVERFDAIFHKMHGGFSIHRGVSGSALSVQSDEAGKYVCLRACAEPIDLLTRKIDAFLGGWVGGFR